MGQEVSISNKITELENKRVIREFRLIFAISSAVLNVSYIVITFIQMYTINPSAPLFLGTGILLILASYLVYNRLKE